MHKYIYFSLAGILAISFVFSWILHLENTDLKRIAADLAANTLRSESSQINAEVYKAREAGKVDGKIEALLLMQNVTQPIDEAFAEKIVSIAESSKPVDLQGNPAFLSLLSQAAYHKGLHVGLETSKEAESEQYEAGYHKALEDFTCPATGNMKTPNDAKQIEIPMKKPK